MRSSQNTIACTSRRGLWVVLLINLVSTLLPQRPAILKKRLCSWPPCVKNKLGGDWDRKLVLCALSGGQRLASAKNTVSVSV
jgi:hypothetical protein